MTFHPANANWLATTSGDDGVLKIWDTVRDRLLCSTNSSKGLWATLAFSSDGRFLAAGAANAVSVNLWQVLSSPSVGGPTLVLKTNLAFVGAFAFSPDNKDLALCNQDSGSRAIVGLYDLASGGIRVFPLGHRDMLHCVAFSPDGRLLATGGADERVVLWDVAGQRQRAPQAGKPVLPGFSWF